MTFKIRKVNNQDCYRVKNMKSTRKKTIFANCTTHENAINQVRLLHGIKYNKTFRNKIKQQQLLNHQRRHPRYYLRSHARSKRAQAERRRKNRGSKTNRYSLRSYAPSVRQ